MGVFHPLELNDDLESFNLEDGLILFGEVHQNIGDLLFLLESINLGYSLLDSFNLVKTLRYLLQGLRHLHQIDYIVLDCVLFLYLGPCLLFLLCRVFTR